MITYILFKAFTLKCTDLHASLKSSKMILLFDVLAQTCINGLHVISVSQCELWYLVHERLKEQYNLISCPINCFLVNPGCSCEHKCSWDIYKFVTDDSLLIKRGDIKHNNTPRVQSPMPRKNNGIVAKSTPKASRKVKKTESTDRVDAQPFPQAWVNMPNHFTFLFLPKMCPCNKITPHLLSSCLFTLIRIWSIYRTHYIW